MRRCAPATGAVMARRCDHAAVHPRRSLRSRALTWLFHLAVAIGTTAPLAWTLGGLPIGREGVATVPEFNLWSLRWTAARLPHGLGGWWNAPIFWPSPGAYARSELQPLTGVGFGIIHWITPDTVAYGLLLIGAITLNGIAMNALARRVGVAPIPAALAGVLAQTIPFAFAQLGVLQLLMLWPILTALTCLLAWAEDPSPRWTAGLGCSLAAAVLTCGYHAVLFTLAALVAAPLLARRSWAREWRVRIGGLLLGAAIAAALTLPFVLGQHRWIAGIEWTDGTIRAGSASWSELAPGGRHWPGTLLVILGVAGAALTFRRRSTRFLLGLGVVATLIALGTRLSIFGIRPYAALVHHFEVFAQMRSPYRATALAQLVLAALAAHSLDWVWRRRRVLGPVLASVAVGAVLITSDLGSGPIVPPPPRHPAWVRYLIRHRGGAVLMVPMAASPSVFDFEPTTSAMLQSLDHGHPLVNGYTGFFPLDHPELIERMRSFPSRATVAELRREDVRYAVADTSWWNRARARSARALGLRVVLRTPTKVVVEIDPQRGSAASRAAP